MGRRFGVSGLAFRAQRFKMAFGCVRARKRNLTSDLKFFFLIALVGA